MAIPLKLLVEPGVPLSYRITKYNSCVVELHPLNVKYTAPSLPYEYFGPKKYALLPLVFNGNAPPEDAGNDFPPNPVQFVVEEQFSSTIVPVVLTYFTSYEITSPTVAVSVDAVLSNEF